MSNEQIIRAWKDVEYRNSLSGAERAMMPQNPAGLIELSDADLVDVAGGTGGLCVSIITVLTVAISVSATASCINC